MLHKLNIAGYCERCDAPIAESEVIITDEKICWRCFEAIVEDVCEAEADDDC